MKCPNCGAQLRGEICEYCGSVVEKPKAENEQKNRGGPKLLVWLVFIFIFVMAITVFIIVLRQFNRVSSFGDFFAAFGQDAPVSDALEWVACGVSPTDAGGLPVQPGTAAGFTVWRLLGGRIVWNGSVRAQHGKGPPHPFPPPYASFFAAGWALPG